MAYKIVKALQNIDLAKRSVKKGDQVEVDEAEADELIKRGLAVAGSMESDAEQRRPGDVQNPGGSLSTSSFPNAPDNKMHPGQHSNK